MNPQGLYENIKPEGHPRLEERNDLMGAREGQESGAEIDLFEGIQKRDHPTVACKRLTSVLWVSLALILISCPYAFASRSDSQLR